METLPFARLTALPHYFCRALPPTCASCASATARLLALTFYTRSAPSCHLKITLGEPFYAKEMNQNSNSQSHMTSPGFQTGLCITKFTPSMQNKERQNWCNLDWAFILPVFILQVEHTTPVLKTLKMQIHSWYKVI